MTCVRGCKTAASCESHNRHVGGEITPRARQQDRAHQHQTCCACLNVRNAALPPVEEVGKRGRGRSAWLALLPHLSKELLIVRHSNGSPCSTPQGCGSQRPQNTTNPRASLGFAIHPDVC
jgi:hypothetical protein